MNFSHEIQRSFENTSYSAMLNIAELVPPPESVPIPQSKEFRPIPLWLDSRNSVPEWVSALTHTQNLRKLDVECIF
jgi:hypothetical protein